MSKKDFNHNFGKRIRELRKREGNMSFRELAENTGISKSYLSDIENAKLPPPSIKKIFAIAKALNEDPVHLAMLAKPQECNLEELLEEHPEISNMIAHVCIELPYRVLKPAIVEFTAQALISEHYGFRMRKLSSEILDSLTNQVKKEYRSIIKSKQ